MLLSKTTVPDYYYRMNPDGTLPKTGTGVGNETASEHEMYRKYMIDSPYWVRILIDGFPFRLDGNSRYQTMQAPASTG